VRLVGVHDVHLAREAAALGAAIGKQLHPARRNPDGVGVVPVRRERPPGEERLDALDPGGARAYPDRVAARTARSFKTAGVDGG
jgi:hypothetical protein